MNTVNEFFRELKEDVGRTYTYRVMEMLNDLSEVKAVLREYASGLNDGGKRAQAVLWESSSKVKQYNSVEKCVTQKNS